MSFGHKLDKQNNLIKRYIQLTLVILLFNIGSMILNYFEIGGNVDKISSLLFKYNNIINILNIGEKIYLLIFLVIGMINILGIILYNIIVISILFISKLFLLGNITKRDARINKVINTIAMIIPVIVILSSVLGDFTEILTIADLSTIFLIIKIFEKFFELCIYIIQTYIIWKYTFNKKVEVDYFEKFKKNN